MEGQRRNGSVDLSRNAGRHGARARRGVFEPDRLPLRRSVAAALPRPRPGQPASTASASSSTMRASPISSAHWRLPSSCSNPASARRSRHFARPPCPPCRSRPSASLITTVLFGVAAFYLTDFSWLESFLLGAAVASTDAAAVFFLLRAGNVQLRDRVRSTLEIESGTNDPIAIFLTITLVEVIAAGADPQAEVLIVDLVAGFVVAYGARRRRRHARRHGDRPAGRAGSNLDHGLLPIFVLTLSLLVFAAGGAVGGSGFLAVYLAGLVAGNSQHARRGKPQALPGRHVLAGADHHVPGARPVRHAVAVPRRSCRSSIALGLFLIFVARPLAVWLCLHPVPLPAPGDRLHLLGRPARRRLDPARHHAAARRAGERPRHLQHRLHRRAGVAGHPGLDRRPAGAPARPHRAAAHRPAGQGRARTAGLGASRTARLHASSPAARSRAASASRAGRGRRWSCATAAR